MKRARSIFEPYEVVLRSDFQAFAEEAFRVVYPNDCFESNWHIQAVCWHLGQVRAGQMPRLIISLPPRSLKSFITSVAWPAFILGRDPTYRVICVSYSDDLARDFACLFRHLIGSSLYRRLLLLVSRKSFRAGTSPRKSESAMIGRFASLLGLPRTATTQSMLLA